MLVFDWLTAVLLILLGGLQGFFLSKIPEAWVYVLAIVVAVLAIVVISRGDTASGAAQVAALAL